MAREWGLECTVSREAVEKPVGRGTENAASPVQQGDLVREKPKKYKQKRGAVPTTDSSQYLQAFDISLLTSPLPREWFLHNKLFFYF